MVGCPPRNNRWTIHRMIASKKLLTSISYGPPLREYVVGRKHVILAGHTIPRLVRSARASLVSHVRSVYERCMRSIFHVSTVISSGRCPRGIRRQYFTNRPFPVHDLWPVPWCRMPQTTLMFPAALWHICRVRGKIIGSRLGYKTVTLCMMM